MNERENKTLIFVETKRKADELTRKMKRVGSVVLLFVYVLVYSVLADVLMVSSLAGQPE